jgi:hypothetical protein
LWHAFSCTWPRINHRRQAQRFVASCPVLLWHQWIEPMQHWNLPCITIRKQTQE